MDKTIVALQEKKIGEAMISYKYLQTTYEMNKYEPGYEPKGGQYQLASGANEQWFIAQKWKARVSFDYMSESEMTTLKTLFSSHMSFIFCPEPDTRPEETFRVIWVEEYGYPYTRYFKGLGYSMELNLIEV
jgi:hypothetical protein